jgi:rhodanese-related sulfurtransferase
MLNKLEGLAKSLSPILVKDKLDRSEDFVFLDVRGPKEYEKVRIDHPSVKLIPLGNLRQDWTTLSKDKEVITFCAASLRGYEAQRILEGEGFKNVKFMDGGMAAWPYEKTVSSR